MSDPCDPNEAMAALSYLRHNFGGFPIPEQEERGHLRMFRTCTVAEARQAIDELVRVADRRPSPNDVAQRVRAIRRAAQAESEDEPWPECTPEVVHRHIDECREILRAKGVRV